MPSAQISWLLFSGVLPILGAAILYLLWGGLRYVASDNKSGFTYHWLEAADPIGWLYGAVIIAVQSTQLSLTRPDGSIFAWLFGCCGFTCLLLLIAAMTDRGAKDAWRPPLTLQIMAGALVLAILYAGFRVHALPIEGVTK
ncbi:MAG TPA: hypothetical protein VL147_13220 [Devosia sp.]|nr:hypothetical protein [Devosia sp.]